MLARFRKGIPDWGRWPKPSRFGLFAACLGIVLSPAFLAVLLRLLAFTAGCHPGAGLCHGLAFGSALSAVLHLSFAIATRAWLVMGLCILASVAAFRAYRPMLGTLTLLVTPVAALLLPMLVVMASEVCAVDSEGACLLWGASFARAEHSALVAREVLFELLPYSVSLSVMSGLAGFFLTRQRSKTGSAQAAADPMAHMRRR